MLKTLSPKGKGLSRDKKIVQAVEEWTVLDADQIRCMFFSGMAYGKRKTQERLLSLYRAERLQRGRQGDKPYYYYLGDKPGMVKHQLAVNWVRLWLQTSLPSWEKIHSWSYEQDYKTLRCDSFVSIKNTMTGKFRFMFIELDRGTNAFDKIEKYNKLYESGKYDTWWWVKLTERFPAIQVVTVSPARYRLIQGKIEAENKSGLEFKVSLLDEIREEVMQKCCGLE